MCHKESMIEVVNEKAIRPTADKINAGVPMESIRISRASSSDQLSTSSPNLMRRKADLGTCYLSFTTKDHMLLTKLEEYSPTLITNRAVDATKAKYVSEKCKNFKAVMDNVGGQNKGDKHFADVVFRVSCPLEHH